MVVTLTLWFLFRFLSSSCIGQMVLFIFCFPNPILLLDGFASLTLQGCKACYDLPSYMMNLLQLRHFLVQDDIMHSRIGNVGALRSLQELKRFDVNKESWGFELRQIGKLVGLRGSLQIYSLENVEASLEAYEAKLMHKNYLHKLTLNWGICRWNMDPAREEQVLECLRPHSNLIELCIKGHGGFTCPSWLGVNLSLKNLESLCLDGVAWKIFPPIGELCLVNEHGEEFLTDIPYQIFQNLRCIELIRLAGLKKWVVDSTGQLFSSLETLIIKGCPELMELSFSRSNKVALNSWRCQQKQDTWFPRLKDLLIYDCPKLLSLPPIPWIHSCSVRIEGVGLGFEQLKYGEDYKSTLSLEIEGKDASDSAFWTALDFHNLTNLRNFVVKRCPPLPLDHLQMLSCLKTLEISDWNTALCLAEDVRYQFPVECISISRLGASGKELTQLLSCMPKLSKLTMSRCDKITGLGVVEHQKATSSSDGVEAQIADQYRRQERLESSSEEKEIATMEVEGLLLLPPQVQELEIRGCPKLSLAGLSEGGGRGGGALHGLPSLRSLDVCDCPEFLLSSYLSSSSSSFPFPGSLQVLCFVRVEGMETLAPLSNLNSLTELQIIGCGDLRGEGLWHLLSHGCLTELSVFETPNFFVGSDISKEHEQGLSFSSTNLQLLWTDDVAGVLAAPMCNLLSTSLTKFMVFENKEMRRFTEEQEEALQLLTSLQELGLQFCSKLQYLPVRLYKLSNLKRLEITYCRAVLSLPNDGLPSSLQQLKISRCPAIQKLPKKRFPSSLQELKISHCPAIQMLPKRGLPSSLRLLDVQRGNSEELRRQCRELTGTIPIVYT